MLDKRQISMYYENDIFVNGGIIMSTTIHGSLEAAAEYKQKGRQAFSENCFDEAITLLHEALRLYRECENRDEIAEVYNLIGVICGAQGDGVRAVKHYLRGLEVAEEQGLFHVSGRLYNNLGSEYQNQGRHENAINYFLRAIDAFKHINADRYDRYNAWMLCTCLNLGISYTETEKYDSAKLYIDAAKWYLELDRSEESAFDILITECRYKWAIGDKAFVYDNLDQLCGEVMEKTSATDYIPETKDICDLLKRMGEYDRWGGILKNFEENSKGQTGYYYVMNCVEMWMDYYKTTEQVDKYRDMCVKHTEFYMQKQIDEKEERSEKLDMLIELYEKEKERSAAERASNKDNLTGIYNRQKLEKDFEEYMRENPDTSIGMGIIDIDFFKEQNDTYGHIKGDECLKKVARAFLDAAGDDALVYRYGGDEFVIMFKDKDYETIDAVGKKVKENVKALQIPNAVTTVSPYLTVSQGYVLVQDISGTESVYSVLKLADQALYSVKKSSKNGYSIYLNKQRL